MELNQILELAMKKGASDVHFKVGIVPVIRKHGQLRPLAPELPALTAIEIEKMANQMMDEEQRRHFHKNKEIDLGYGVAGLGRFRVNIFLQRGTVRMVIRNIPHKIPTFAELNLPPILAKIADNERGLILVTGITGSGKSSTLAAILDHINRTKNKHILTIEDPIEFLIRDRKSIVSQRELGADTNNYSNALRAALRQDPDVILIGEMRDRETTEIALLAAETGHLVLSTLHTMDAQESINRIVSLFDAQQQTQVRMQIAAVLKAIVSQRLARRKDKKGFVPAVEVLINNARVKEMIMDAQKTIHLIHAMEEGQVAWGMQTFDQSLLDLVGRDLVDYEEARKLSSNPEDFQLRHSGISAMDGKKWGPETAQGRDRLRQVWNENEIELDDPEKPRASGEDD